MSVDVLQDKIRCLKNPAVVDFSVLPEQIPPHIRRLGDPAGTYAAFCLELLEGLKDVVPGVRFSFDRLALLGAPGLEALAELTAAAARLGYYVILDAPGILTPQDAARTADVFSSAEPPYSCDALVVSPYIGSDALKPFVRPCAEGKLTVFSAVRTPNRSASELQDLLTGSRHVHTAAVDLLSRTEDQMLGRLGYSRFGALAACSGSVLKNLRSKYPRLFLLADGCDLPGGNAKNASYAFDSLGRGAAVCVGASVTAAWYTLETDGTDFVEQAVLAARRLKKSISGYVTFL